MIIVNDDPFFLKIARIDRDCRQNFEPNHWLRIIINARERDMHIHRISF